MTVETLDLVSGWASFILTLFIFSYLLTDNILYRIAVHILVGASAAFVAIIAVESVVIPWVSLTIFPPDGEETNLGFQIIGVMPFLLSFGLLLKSLPSISHVGNPLVAIIMGIGVGVAIVGAVVGTIIPLVQDTSDSYVEQNTFSATIAVLGTIGTLVYFQYLSRRDVNGDIQRRWPFRMVANFGKGILVVTFATVYAGMMITSLTVFTAILSQQVAFLIEQIG